jgi:hypothetical protein
MKMALRNGGLNLEDISYINAHGTSTPQGDVCETQAIKTVFGERAKKIAVSSTKGATGHMLGAAGAVEMTVCALAIKHGIVPPTINYQVPDPECDLDYVPNTAREMKVNAIINNSFGFGGHNASIAAKIELSQGNQVIDRVRGAVPAANHPECPQYAAPNPIQPPHLGFSNQTTPRPGGQPAEDNFRRNSVAGGGTGRTIRKINFRRRFMRQLGRTPSILQPAPSGHGQQFARTAGCSRVDPRDDERR